MTTSTTAPAPAKTLRPTPLPRPLRAASITHGEAHDGRLPVVVTVVPVADLDAKGGVFVDFRMGVKGPDGSDTAPRLDADAPASTLQQGDKAVAALAAREAAAAPAAPSAPAARLGPTETTQPSLPAVPSPIKKAASTRQPLVSQQIGQATKLTVGQAETFRADVALPPAPADASQAWYVRARFATFGGRDLTSAWLLV